MSTPENPRKPANSGTEQKEYREFLWLEPGFHRTLGSRLIAERRLLYEYILLQRKTGKKVTILDDCY